MALNEELLKNLQSRLQGATLSPPGVGTPAGEVNVENLTPASGALDALEIMENRKNVEARKAELTEAVKSGFEELNTIERELTFEKFFIEPTTPRGRKRIRRKRLLNPYFDQEARLNFEKVRNRLWTDTASELRGLTNELRLIDPEMNAMVEQLGRAAAAVDIERMELERDVRQVDALLFEQVKNGQITKEMATQIRPDMIATLQKIPTMNSQLKDEADTQDSLNEAAEFMSNEAIERYGPRRAPQMKRSRAKLRRAATKAAGGKTPEDFLESTSLISWFDKKEKSWNTLLKSGLKLPTETETFAGTTQEFTSAKTHIRTLADHPALTELAKLRAYDDFVQHVAGNVSGEEALRIATKRIAGSLPPDLLEIYENEGYGDLDEAGWRRQFDTARLDAVDQLYDRAGLKRLTGQERLNYMWEQPEKPSEE